MKELNNFSTAVRLETDLNLKFWIIKIPELCHWIDVFMVVLIKYLTVIHIIKITSH